jgi:hypothetical protein
MIFILLLVIGETVLFVLGLLAGFVAHEYAKATFYIVQSVGIQISINHIFTNEDLKEAKEKLNL